MRLAWIKSKWGILLLLQIAAIIAVALWGWHTLAEAERQADDFFVPTHCANGHDTIHIVDIVYGRLQHDGARRLLQEAPVQVHKEELGGPASPAFLFQCSTCDWQIDGWTIETVLKLQGQGELPILPEMNE